MVEVVGVTDRVRSARMLVGRRRRRGGSIWNRRITAP